MTSPLGISIGVVVVVLPCLTAFTPTPAMAERPVTVQGTECQVWDQYPDLRKTLRWSGACRSNWVAGPGVLTWYYSGRYDGQVEGTFVDGRLDGHARVTRHDGRRFDGNFRRGRASGSGTHTWPNGRVYQGEWQDDHRTGFGTLRYPDGTRYVGEFYRNRPTGRGEFVAADGQHFQARIDARGNISAGSFLGRPPQAAAIPPATAPPPPAPSALDPATKPPRLEDWLNETIPVPRTNPH